MEADVSGIVLAGGMSRRLGRNKALEQIGGEALISRVLGRVGQLAAETLVVVADCERASALPLPDDAKIAVDVFPDTGSLGGIYSGLESATAEWAIAVACDMPFLNVDLFRHLLSLREDFDVVIPEIGGRPEPTHALYRKACLPHMRSRLEAGRLKIIGFFENVRVNLVPEDVIDAYDPERLSFFNVNTQEDLDRALSLAGSGV